jgi:polyphenol oxidase
MHQNSSLNFNMTQKHMQLHIEQPHIFPPSIIAGVTKRNTHLFPETGLSLLKAQILGDDEVEHHRLHLANAIGVERRALKFQKQVHGTNIRVLSPENHEQHINEPFNESDGMMTATPGFILCAGIADCAAVLLYDPEHHAVAALHSGWKGTHENIVRGGVEQMTKRFGTQPASLLAYISPCASGQRYVVREDVAQFFTAPALQRLNDEEFLFDNRLRIQEQLQENGVLLGHIEVASGCTISTEEYHSHRRDGERAGRMVAFIGIRAVTEN